MDPVQIPTRETVRFITDHAHNRARVLEVGCGSGEVAEALKTRGHQVVAIDTDAAAVARARQRGVDARVAHWPQFIENPFDVIVFTRSLHHIQPLAAALDEAAKLLAPGGAVMVEDFAFDELKPAFAGWFYELLALLEASAALPYPDTALREELLAVQRGHSLHRDHHLHTATTLRDALSARFRLTHLATAPYLYRYICREVAATPQGGAVVEAALALERSLGEIDSDCWIGRRFVARKPG
ncbi:class I SAM-dependent methyltransferase [Exilibacterium tricleocarpae]|uniref:Class I SAM-dependent methyltransferase n=1 Tax=Exilibacterium tricleocarpae TaxID=2591008 RepID=A0A545TFQ9_9GAMM|nr:class I SAM-dependent methyltransferase [Exilibacterium tricleocarpae]TQV76067.1 class I SAM-dependent methyltransferase [Exilibacterium tricleocarpae]